MMRTWVAALALLLWASRPVGAQSLVCFGNEPSWSVVLSGPTAARLVLPEQPDVEYRGVETRLLPLRERIWRGAPTSGAGGDLVVFLRDGDCSDQMSGQTHPVIARVSLPDGRALAGCCRVPEAAAAPVATVAAPLPIEGREWELTELRGQPAKALAALRAPITVRFGDGRLQAFAGCNQLMGGYVVAADRLRLDALAGTMMACAPPVMAVEQAFKAALAGTLVYRVAGDRLTLAAADDAQPRMTFRAAPPPQLEGIAWLVSGYNNGRQAVVSPLPGTTLTLNFGAGAVTGHAGCNSFRGPYTREAMHLTIGPLAVTRKHCAGGGVMDQERAFLAALESTTAWAIDRGMLDLHAGNGERVLTAHRTGSR